MTQSPVDLSVVILNWNARDFLLDCLRSIQAHPTRAKVEVLVVDNGSYIDDSVAAARKNFPDVPVINAGRNLGFARGNNVGLRAAQGRYVLFLNPDTIVHQGAFDALVEWMDAYPRAGAAGPKLLNPDGSLQTSCRGFPSPGVGLFRNTPLGRIFPHNPWTRDYLMGDFSHEKPAQVDWLSGAALVLRREALEEIGDWDEAFFMYCEDVDMGRRLADAGWERWYVPDAVITHRIGGSSDWAQGAMIRQHHGSMLRYWWKHHKNKPDILLTPIVTAGVGARAAGAVVKLYRGYAMGGSLGSMARRKLKGE